MKTMHGMVTTFSLYQIGESMARDDRYEATDVDDYENYAWNDYYIQPQGNSLIPIGTCLFLHFADVEWHLIFQPLNCSAEAILS